MADTKQGDTKQAEVRSNFGPPAIIAGLIVAGLLFVLVVVIALEPPVDPAQETRDAMVTALEDAVDAQSAHRRDAGTYASDVAALESSGLEVPVDVVLNVTSSTDRSYCIEATHADLAGVYMSVDSNDGEISERPCT